MQPTGLWEFGRLGESPELGVVSGLELHEQLGEEGGGGEGWQGREGARSQPLVQQGRHLPQCFQAQIRSILIFIFSLLLLSDLVFIDYM